MTFREAKENFTFDWKANFLTFSPSISHGHQKISDNHFVVARKDKLLFHEEVDKTDNIMIVTIKCTENV